MTTSQRFDLRFGNIRWLLSLLGTGPSRSWVEVDDTEVRVRMGWAFRATIPRSAIQSVDAEDMKGWVGIGVHGFRGRWQVNGALGRGVAFDLAPGSGQAVRARVCFVPIRLKRLRVGVTDHEGLLTALR